MPAKKKSLSKKKSPKKSSKSTSKKPKRVIVYSTPTCHWCGLTKHFLQDNRIKFTEYNVAADSFAREESIRKSGQMGVPVIDIKGEIVIGFDREALIRLLKIRPKKIKVN